MNIYIDDNLNKNNIDIAESFFSTPKHRPFIAISLGSTPPPIEVAVQILKWSLISHSPIIPILFADDIATINYRAFGDSETRAIKEVDKSKRKHFLVWQEALNYLEKNEKPRVRFINWKDILNPDVQEQQNFVREIFNCKGELYKSILTLVESFISSAGKTYTLKRGLIMAEYVIQELPSLIFGIKYDEINYQMTLYPTYTSPKEFQNFLVAVIRNPDFKLYFNKYNKNELEYCKFIHMIISDKNKRNEKNDI